MSAQTASTFTGRALELRRLHRRSQSSAATGSEMHQGQLLVSFTANHGRQDEVVQAQQRVHGLEHTPTL